MGDQNLSGEQAVDKLKSIINDVNIAMMCTFGNHGRIESRPMGTAGVDDDGTIWFFTNDSSDKIKQIESEHGICLSYSKPSDNTYASINGKALVVDDKAKEKELWNDLLKAWFPKGLDDPNMTLIKFTPHQAEYWDSNDSKMVVFFKMAKAAITGKPYSTDKDAHGNIQL